MYYYVEGVNIMFYCYICKKKLTHGNELPLFHINELQAIEHLIPKLKTQFEFWQRVGFNIDIVFTWPKSLVRGPPSLHASSVKKKTSLSPPNSISLLEQAVIFPPSAFL